MLFKKFPKVNQVRDDDDTSARLLNTCFQMLVDFVEKEKAMEWAMVHRVTEEIPSNWRFFSWRFFPWYRNPESGVKRLEEETAITVDGENPSRQSEMAMEILTLYRWWKDVRPLREDPFDKLKPVSGQGDVGKIDLETAENMEAEEQSQWDEDQEMFKRLVEVRGALWS